MSLLLQHISIFISIYIYEALVKRGDSPYQLFGWFFIHQRSWLFSPKHIALAVVPKRCWDVRELNCLAANWWNDMRIKKGKLVCCFTYFDSWKNNILFSIPLHFNAIHLTINHLQSLLLYSDLVLFLDWNLRSFRLCLCQSIHVLLILRAGVSVWSFSVLVSMNSLHNNDKMRPCWSNNPQMEYPPEV